MKVACLQFNQIIGEVERNQNFASKLLEKYQPGDIDILVLPELAFTGYVFKDKDHIRPYLEDSETGTSVQWAQAQAVRLRAFVVVGYPQIVKGNPDKYYNSLCFVDPYGKLIETYQKSHLYTTDESWAEEGPGFKSIYVPNLGKIGLGICMDLNPYQFRASFREYEFASYHIQQQTEIILCSMAWLQSSFDESQSLSNESQSLSNESQSLSNESQSLSNESQFLSNESQSLSNESQSLSNDDDEPSYSTINYWCSRLLPYFTDSEAYCNVYQTGSQTPGLKRNVLFVVCNRTGTENGSHFAGSSSVLLLSSKCPIMLGSLKSKQETVMVVDVQSL